MISAILLAAGQSRRMGTFKQLLPFGGSTVIDSSIANLRAANIDELIVVLGYRATDLAAKLADAPVILAINQAYREGMTRSIQTGLAQVSKHSHAILLALVDQPHIPRRIINQLIAAYQSSRATIVKPQYQG